jgi:ATP-dependent Clp protease ATP-binding subunit ClpA
MLIENINFTPNAYTIIQYAENIARECNFNAIHPIHLFLGALEIDCEVNNELKSIFPVDTELIKKNLNSYGLENVSNDYVKIKIGGSIFIKIFMSTKDIFIEAKRLAELYEEHGQIFVDEGHILRAIFSSGDEITKKCLGNLDKNKTLSIIASQET